VIGRTPSIAARRAPSLVAALLLTLACAACGGDTPAPSAALPALDPKIALEAQQRAAAAALRRENEERGWECGYNEAWEVALVDARDAAPLRWRSTTFGAVLTVGLVAFAVGVVGLLLLALLLPRLRPHGRGAAEDDDEPRHGLLAFLRAGMTRILDGLGRLLRVEIFDRHAADQRLSAIHDARDAERLITATISSVKAVADEADSGRSSELVTALEDWRADLDLLAERLEAHGPWAPRVEPAPLVGRMVKSRRAAQQLRLECARAELAGAHPDDATWATWRQLVEGRPALPVDRSKEARRGPLPSWVRPTGWAGVAALAVAVPTSAAWTAAGAFPLFFVLLFSFGGLGATFAARIWLFQHGRRALLPGLADRVARTLTWMALLTTVLVTASSMTATESGLDLGDPPPVERPAELGIPPLPLILGTPAPASKAPPAPTPEAPPAPTPEAPPTPTPEAPPAAP
jgi:hypothetical protein